MQVNGLRVLLDCLVMGYHTAHLITLNYHPCSKKQAQLGYCITMWICASHQFCLQEFPAMERATNLLVGTSASVTMRYPSKERMAMEGRSATCPSLALSLTAAT